MNVSKGLAQSSLPDRIRRSTLIMPVHNSRLVEKAYLRGADCICLDLEDSVPSLEKEKARDALKQAIQIVGKGGMDVLVRINNDSQSTVLKDLRASIWPGLAGLIIPKVENANQIIDMEADIVRVENERGIDPGKLGLWVVVETAKGVKNVYEIAGASKRIEFLSAGDEDLALDLGISPTMEGNEFAYVKSKVVIAARAAGVTPLGLSGTLADFADLEGLSRSAMKAKSLGFKGAMAIHPSQIPILNEMFSPTADEISASINLVELYEKAISQGKGSVQFNGKMVDTPVYERAKNILSLGHKIKELEARKKLVQ
jgi:citrate lyase subunit beta / citryl-CoA lyase